MSRRFWTGMTALLWCAVLQAGPGPGAATTPAAVRHGEYRTWHDNGRLASVRRYVNGREAGLQQSWTPDGVLYLNYEVRNGRRYGLVNARPCDPVVGGVPPALQSTEVER